MMYLKTQDAAYRAAERQARKTGKRQRVFKDPESPMVSSWDSKTPMQWTLVEVDQAKPEAPPALEAAPRTPERFHIPLTAPKPVRLHLPALGVIGSMPFASGPARLRGRS